LCGVLALGACGASEQRPAATPESEVSAGGSDQTKEVQRENAKGVESNHSASSDNAASSEADSHAVDNTGINRRDADTQNAHNATPENQGENGSDLEITQRIRKAVMADDSLSFTAKNTKIITQNGQVELRGSVKSAAEQRAIGAHANDVVGAARVQNQLEVAP
jgi:osmotically-inducible protein OsmY